ncbi:NAD-dependent epimerase/dehydratase family protein [Streptomyces sp. NPDC059193]|uniref:NAD-dependent epimerase/dehydratase family protein n=1 Tax=Streptomyces sp. NPDC059193 TaxID=3346763 RepID=UPI0036C4E1BE
MAAPAPSHRPGSRELPQPSVGHLGDAPADPLHHQRVVRHHHQRHPEVPAQLVEQPEDRRRGRPVEGSLVEVLAGRRPAGRPPLVLYSGAASQTGLPRAEPIDGSEPDLPETEYDRRKLRAEQLLKEATAAGAVRGVSLRLPTVFGRPAAPGADDRGVVSFMVRRGCTSRSASATPSWAWARSPWCRTC